HLSLSPSTPPPPLSPLSLHDALPISRRMPSLTPLSHRFRQAPAWTAPATSNWQPPSAPLSPRHLFPQKSSRPSPWPIGRSLPEKDRKSTRLNSSHVSISYAVFCLKKK